jgi:hypothetical protein
MNPSTTTIFTSYIDDDSANVILTDQFENIFSEQKDNHNLTRMAMNDDEALLIFTPENIINYTDILPDNITVKNEVGFRDSYQIIIPITVCYLIIFVAGVLGNVITCIVIAKNKTMHTATNYYLFNLAVSDFLVLVTGKYY